jgi:hypothetical protein
VFSPGKIKRSVKNKSIKIKKIKERSGYKEWETLIKIIEDIG